MTRREFLETVKNGTINEEVIAKAEELIVKMDAENEKRKNRVSKKALENEPIKEAIKGVLGDEPKTATEIGAEVGISVQKASALLRQIEGLTVVEVKTKKGKVKGYSF